MNDRPVVRVQLPSRGMFYDGRLPDGWMEVSPMTTREEKLLLSPGQDRVALLDKLIKKCLATETIPLGDLLVADRFYLLLAIRNITYGASYELQLTCPQCVGKFSHTLKIPDDLELRILTTDDKEPFEVELPISKKTVGLRLLRVKDEAEVQRFVQQPSLAQKFEEGDRTYTPRLARHFVSMDGEPVTTIAALRFCEGMIGGDSVTIRKAIEDHDCGVDLNLTVPCARCGVELEQTLPFTNEFFRPGIISDPSTFGGPPEAKSDSEPAAGVSEGGS